MIVTLKNANVAAKDVATVELGERVIIDLYNENLFPGTMVAYDVIAFRGYEAQQRGRRKP